MLQIIILAGCVYIINEFRKERKTDAAKKQARKVKQLKTENMALSGLDERVEYWTRNGSFNREQYLKYISQ